VCALSIGEAANNLDTRRLHMFPIEGHCSCFNLSNSRSSGKYNAYYACMHQSESICDLYCQLLVKTSQGYRQEPWNASCESGSLSEMVQEVVTTHY